MAGLNDTEDARFKALIEDIMRRGVRPHEIADERIRNALLDAWWKQQGLNRPVAQGASLGGMITGK